MSATRPEQQEAPQDHVDRRIRDLNCGDLPDLDPDVEGIVERIQGINKRLQAVMEETLGDHDLSYGEWRVLCALRRKPERASTPGELAAKVELSSGAMTSRLDRMEREGLIRRLPDPTDRRGVRVELTDDGDSSWIESTNAQAIKEALIASALSKQEQHQLNTLLRKLMLALEEPAPPTP